MNDSTPCQHYDTTSRLCTIYELRPFDCSEFPHFHRKDFYDQVEDVFAPNMPRCPATLVWVEQIEALSQTKLNIK
jgi:Fe-S-cluster containining protein